MFDHIRPAEQNPKAEIDASHTMRTESAELFLAAHIRTHSRKDPLETMCPFGDIPALGDRAAFHCPRNPDGSINPEGFPGSDREAYAGAIKVREGVYFSHPYGGSGRYFGPNVKDGPHFVNDQ